MPRKIKNKLFEVMRFVLTKVRELLARVDPLIIKLKTMGAKMIGPIEKEFKKAELLQPPVGTYEGVDLRILPRSIAFKAALLKEKMTINSVLMAVLFLFAGHYLTTRLEVSSLYKKLREKEYILAPGVLDFTAASPQSVPTSYINDAVSDFLSDLGNINAANVDEQYQSLKRFMSDELKVKFSMETSDWIEQIKTENISQLLTITKKEITDGQNGAYKVVALGRADFYANGQYLGHEDQVIEMEIKLVPPESGKRWYLQIFSLTWNKADTFKVKSNLEHGQ